MDTPNYTPEEYQALVEKIKNGTATPDEIKVFEDLVANAMKELDAALTPTTE